MTKRLLLARHAQVDPQLAGRFLGSTDVPLSEYGLRQTSALAQTLSLQSDAPIVASPMCRVVQTAEAFGREFSTDPDLREIDFGRWEGLSFDEITASESSDLIDGWSRFDPLFVFPGGESLAGFTERVGRAADRLSKMLSDTVLVITHGGVIRTMICLLLGLDPSNYLLFEVQPASITTIDLYEGRGVLTGLNNLSHWKETLL